MSIIPKSPGESGGRRSDVLRVVQGADAPLSVVQIADALDIHPNTVRFHLETLVEEGKVELAEPDHRGRGRPALMYRAVRGMDRGGVRRYRLLAEILTIGMASDDDPSTKAAAAGRAWGRRIQEESGTEEPIGAEESIDQLVEMLDGLGFAPERREVNGEKQVGLRHCPFLELAESCTEVVCPVHLGLMQGALEAWDAPVAIDRLDAFAEPDLCIAHLRPATTRDGGKGSEVRPGVRVKRLPGGPVRVEGSGG